MIAPPPQPKLVKCQQNFYYTLLCKVSDWCLLFNFKNQELQISNRVATTSSNNSIQRLFLWQLALWPTISRLSWERTSSREPQNFVWRSCGLRCQFLWMKCADRFSCAATQFLVINAAQASRAMQKATAIARWMTRSSSLSFWRPPRQTFASATSICLLPFV